MPTPYPPEFRRDVIAVARRGEQSRAQVARSFGVSESCLARWLAITDRDNGRRAPRLRPHQQATTPRCASCAGRDKQLEQENEILRRATAYLAQDTLPK